jgi:hypothetical protein
MVRADGDHIVVTVTPQQAEVMATAIASSAAARRDPFLRELARSVAVQATRRDVAMLSRGAFIRGRWSNSKSSTATFPSGLAVVDDARVVGPVEAVSTSWQSAPQSEPQPGLGRRRIQDMNPAQLAEYQRRVVEAMDGANSAEAAAARATQAAAVVQLRTDATVLRAEQASGTADDDVESMELAEENALSAAAIARAVAAAATQAAATAQAAAEKFESEVASAAAALGVTLTSAPTTQQPPAPVPPAAERRHRVENQPAPESVETP